jgi:hypothetical protein
MHFLQLAKAYKTTHRAARRKRAMRVRLPIPPSREALQPPVRVASARSISIPVRKSIGPSRSTDQENLVRCGLHEKAGERFGRRLQGSGLGAGRRALIDLD